MSIFRRRRPADPDLDEWARHHDDPRSGQGMALMVEAQTKPDLTADELRALWQQANHLVGQRAPADYGEFLAYGYFEGRRDALTYPFRASIGAPTAESPSCGLGTGWALLSSRREVLVAGSSRRSSHR